MSMAFKRFIMWTRSKSYLLLSVLLFFLLPVFSWGEVVLSDDQYRELDQVITELSQINQDQAQAIKSLRVDLRTSQAGLTISKLETKEQKAYSKGLEESLRKQKTKAIIDAIITGLIAASLGFIAGILSGL